MTEFYDFKIQKWLKKSENFEILEELNEISVSSFKSHQKF